MDSNPCGPGGGANTYTGLRIASVFVILVGSLFGAFFPILTKRTKLIRVPPLVFDFAKYFGSGVIVTTAFIHLLSPGTSELASPCLSAAWAAYPYSFALALLSIFMLFIVEFIAFRWGTAKLAKGGFSTPAHMLAHSYVENDASKVEKAPSDVESDQSAMTEDAMAKIIGVAILEFGVLLHSTLIGLTLAVDPNFITLFVVIIFHQMFEGLGVGTRLAFLELPRSYRWAPYVGAALYGITTPIGIAAGLGVRTTYNPGSTTASIVSGVMDSFSGGILVYTGLVELMAHEFLFNKEMLAASNKRITFLICSMLLGAGLMALLGRWA